MLSNPTTALWPVPMPMTLLSRLRRYLPSLSLSCALLPISLPATVHAADLTLKTLRVGNLSRTYFSERGGHNEPLPLIIALHGSGSTGSLLARDTGLTELAENAGYMVAYPNGTGLTIDARTWNSGKCCGYAQMHQVDDIGFIRALVNKLVAERLADKDRVYVVGLSNGGMLAYRLAAEAPDLFKAVAVVAGVMDVPAETIKKAMPVMHVHGTEDPLLPYKGGVGAKATSQTPMMSVADTIHTWIKANSADPTPAMTEIPDTAKDDTSVRQFTYHSKTDPQSIVLYEVKGGGHNWPGGTAPYANGGKSSQNLDTTRSVITFFNQHGGASPAAAPSASDKPAGNADAKSEAAQAAPDNTKATSTSAAPASTPAAATAADPATPVTSPASTPSTQLPRRPAALTK